MSLALALGSAQGEASGGGPCGRFMNVVPDVNGAPCDDIMLEGAS